MREIKFRVWDKGKHQMYYNCYPIDKRNIFVDFRYDADFEQYEIDSEDVIENDEGILMQYTGSKDKYGKEIYEGDILSISGYSYEEPEFECGGEVKYINCGYCIEDEGEFVNIADFRGSYCTIFKVIGNVYENPNLLE